MDRLAPVGQLLPLSQWLSAPSPPVQDGAPTDPQPLLLRLDEQSEQTAAGVRQALQAAEARGVRAPPMWIGSRANAAPAVSSAMAALPGVCVAFPLSAAPDTQPKSESARVEAWSRQSRLAPSRVVLQLSLRADGDGAAMDAERVRALDGLACAWVVQAQPTGARDPSLHALLHSLLTHSSLPVLLVAPLLPQAATELAGATLVPSLTAVALRWLDSLAVLPALHKLHLALERVEGGASADGASGALAACPPDVSLLSHHWTAMRKREQFRAAKLAPTLGTDRAGRPRPSATSDECAAGAVPSGVPTPAPAAPAAAAAPAQFYRAAFTPTTMFYRLAISFSPSLSLSDLLCHSLLQEGIRSLLGSIGLAKCGLQLLHWDAETSTAIVSTRSEMSVGARAAWMLMGTYQQKTVRIDVQQQSLFLAAIAMHD